VVRTSLLTLSGLSAAYGISKENPSFSIAMTTTFFGAAQIDLGKDGYAVVFKDDDELSSARKLCQSARGSEAARAELIERLRIEPKMAGMVYDMWKSGDSFAYRLLHELDAEHYAGMARFEPHAVFALSFLSAAANTAARRVMRDLEVLELAAVAKKDKYAVFALNHLLKAENEIAGEMMRRLDVSYHAAEASKNPFAVYALSHLSRAGNLSAREAMRNLNIEELIGNIDQQGHVLRAITVLLEAGHEKALPAMVSRIKGLNREKILFYVKSMTVDPIALFKIYYLVRNKGREAKDFLKALDISKANLNIADLYSERKWALIDAIQHLAKMGNESAIALLAKAALNNCWAVWSLSNLKYKFKAAATAMEQLDVSRYEEPAKVWPDVVLTLQLLAIQENPGAIRIMKNLDPSVLAQKASSSNDQAAMYAMSALCRTGNEQAIEAMFELAKKAPVGLKELESIAKEDVEEAKTISLRLKAIRKATTSSPGGTKLY